VVLEGSREDGVSRNERLWIAWERQRRSLELAPAFGCQLAVFEYRGLLGRYIGSLARTLALVVRRRPSVLFVQNPSMILAASACAIGPVLRMPVVVDRHTTFLIGKDVRATFRRRVFWMLHLFTLRRAALTIVSNAALADMVRAAGGRAAVLPDRIPAMRPASRYPTADAACVVCPTSYGEDEPLEAVLEACRQLPDGVHVYITGNFRKHDPSLPGRAPANVTFTGFLSEQDYVDLLFAADAVLALTTAECCMLCACYEALAAEKALITSDKAVLRDYFTRAVFVRNTPESIAQGIREFAEHRDRCAADSRAMRRELSEKWSAVHRGVSTTIDALG
jgi:glycosyltransferase involved in cell wall biosynthesis